MLSETFHRSAVQYMQPGAADNLVAASQADYDRFCSYVMRYARVLGLTDWFISFYWENNSGKAPACVYYNWDTKSASFIFGTKIAPAFAQDERVMMRLALHETLHLLFAGFDYLKDARDLPSDRAAEMWEGAEHSIIRALEQALLCLDCATDYFTLSRVYIKDGEDGRQD